MGPAFRDPFRPERSLAGGDGEGDRTPRARLTLRSHALTRRTHRGASGSGTPGAWPQSERIARRVLDAETVIFEHSGHVPWLGEPDAFFDAVVDWLHRRALA
jgi:pimeloyl-ACP methyl ester carboxylesterase